MNSPIQVCSLNKTYHSLLHPTVTALNDVSFTILQGETVAFLGPNGAGKTTAIKIILDLLRPDHGSVRIFDGDPEGRKRIGYLPENPSFYRFLTGFENLLSLARMVNPNISLEKVDETLKLVGLYDAEDRPVKSYSRGMIQRLGIAQAIIHDPDLLILDEPLSSLDPIGRREMREILINMKKRGKTIFFSTHILPDVDPLADRVIVINKGKIVSDLSVDEIANIEDHLIQILK